MSSIAKWAIGGAIIGFLLGGVMPAFVGACFGVSIRKWIARTFWM